MIDIKALRQQKADLVTKNSQLLSTAETANRDLTAAESTEYEANKASIASLNTRIKRAEDQMDEERNAPASAVIEVGKNRAENKPWKGMGEQLCSLAKTTKLIQHGRASQGDPRILAALGSSETVPSDGGFLVEPEYNQDLLQRTYNTGEVAKRCKRMSMNSARMIINAVDEDSRVDGSRWGGLLSYWLAEAQSYTGTKPKFREVQLVANKLIALVYATEELLDDTSLLESYVKEIVPQELAFQTDEAIINGTGAGQPLGILTAPATVSQTADSGDSSTKPVSTNDILNMWSRLYAPYRKDAVWFINQSIEPYLYPLTLGSPSLGQILIYTPPGVNGNNSGYGLLMGRPVIPIEQTADVGTVGDIILFGPDGYLLAQRNEIRADSSIHVAFLTGEQAFRFMLRLDGQPWWKKPLTPYASGAPTLAPFVTLASSGR
jgi:HK97 family phage major capsid protein